MMTTFRTILYTLLVICYLLGTLTGWGWTTPAVGVLSILCLAVSLHDAKRMFQIVGSLFIAAGIACVVWAGIPLQALPYLMTSNVMLISLLYMLPFVNHVIRIGGYDRHMSRWLNVRKGHVGHLYARSLVVSYLLCLFLFFAALPLLHRVLGKHFADNDRGFANRFMAMSVLRGFGTVAVWNPVEPLVATAVLFTGVSYMALFPWMFGLSLALLAVGALSGLRFRRMPLAASEEAGAKAPSWPKTLAFMAALVLLISLAAWLYIAADISFFAAMTLVLLPFSAVWAIVLKRFRRFCAVSRRQWRVSTDGLRHMLVLFLSFGFFNSAVAKTPLLEQLEGPIQALSQSPLLLFAFIWAAGMVLPVLGIHPLVVMSLFGLVLQPVLQVLSPLSVAIVLITSCLASSFMGTFNTTVTIMSGLIRVNPYRITLWNFGFAFIYGGMGIALALCLL